MGAGEEISVYVRIDADLTSPKATGVRVEVNPAPRLILDEALAGVAFTQLKVKHGYVKVYLTFADGYTGKLQLRAYNDKGLELGRSDKSDRLKLGKDEAGWYSFRLPHETPFENVSRFTLLKAK